MKVAIGTLAVGARVRAEVDGRESTGVIREVAKDIVRVKVDGTDFSVFVHPLSPVEFEGYLQ